MAKTKTNYVIVKMVSLITGHTRVAIRPKLNDKVEMLRYDPVLQDMAPYQELEKIKSIRRMP